ncbi:glycosyltransferase [Planosporangium sp. 12N6]|uniref:glycosyltransferase n=1 Tax=Planosporangium spinosum TaxID=3402278 RepID=UPI003CEBF9E9
MQIIARMNVGGPALLVSAVLRDLEPERFDQRLYAGEVGDDEADYLRLCAPDLPVHRVPGLGRSVRPGDDLRALGHLVTAMRRFRPHIVHTHTAKAGVLGRIAAGLAGVPAQVHTYHGHLLHGYFSRSVTRAVTGAERALAHRTARLVAVGARVRDDLLAAGIGRPEQYAVLPPGTDLRPAPPAEEARALLGLPARGPVIAYVGRITGIKRPDRLVGVARAVLASAPDATFVACGDGDLFGELTEATADLGDAIRLLGWRADVETVYAAADVTLLTSDNEGMPVSLIESGLAGVPAVATHVGSVAEIVVDGRTGLLAAPHTAAGHDGPAHDERALTDELAAHVVRLLHDHPLRLEMGRQARELTADRFGTRRLVAGTRDLYTSLAAERGWLTSARA